MTRAPLRDMESDQQVIVPGAPRRQGPRGLDVGSGSIMLKKSSVATREVLKVMMGHRQVEQAALLSVTPPFSQADVQEPFSPL